MSSDDSEKPHIRLAVANDQSGIDKARAKEAIEWPLRELAANVMRISRGAGKPYEILEDCIKVVQRFQQYREVHGVWPSSSEVQEILNFHDPRLRDYSLPYDEMAHAIERIARGSLRMAAGRLVSQQLQADHGENEMLDGIREIEEFRIERRAKRAAEMKAARKTPNAKPLKKLIRKPKL